jgi:hypothetical protein
MSSKNFYGLTGDVTVDGGILNVGNAQLYANTETSNVGIGTSNPEFELDVRGDANVHNLYATYLHGDGSNIENIVSSQWEGSPGDPIYYASNVGIANTSPVTTTMQIGSNVVVDDVGSNVLHVTGNVYATRFIGDGAFLENIASSFQAITDNGNVTTNTVEFDGSTALVTTGSVGIANTAPVHDLNVGSNLYVEDAGSNVLHVTGNIYADYFVGDGSQLTGIAASLDQIVDQGNTVSNTIQLVSGQDAISNIGLVTHDGVGISVSNTNPTGEFQFGVGSNLLVNVYSSNVLTVDGNVFAQKMTLGTVTVTPAYNLQQIMTTGATTNQTLVLSNVTTGLTTSSNVGIANTAPVHTLDVGSNLYVEDTGSNVLTVTGNAYVTERLNVGSNLHIENLQVAEVAANLVTYDATTGELMDSAGVFSNKLAVVSEQPPIALTGASTAVTSHGTYTIEASSTSSDSSVQYLFDKDDQTVWKTDNDPLNLKYTDGGVYDANASLAGVSGEWVKITMPYKTILRHVKIESTNSSIKDVTLVGLNADGISWTTLKTVDGLNEETSTIIVNATTHHRTYGLIVEATNSGATQAEIGDLKLFTESFSIDGGKVAMASSAVMGGDTIMDQHGPHGRADVPLRKYPEIVFEEGKFDRNDTTNTYVQAGYTVTASSQANDDKNVAKLYDDRFPRTDDQESGWQSKNNTYDSSTGVALSVDTLTGITGATSSRDGSYTTLELPHKIKLSYLQIHARNSVDHGTPVHPKQVYVYGSNDGSSWTQVGSHLFTSVPATAIWQRIDINSTTPYKYFALQATSILPYLATNLNRVYILDLEWYGYEERSLGDTAVDTTFSSMYNTPDSTNMKAYGDASVSVSTPTNLVVGGPSTTGSSWTLDGSLTSNISLEANTFLEGDQPHTVSIWLNSSNLEANTSNSVIFSLGTEEVIRSDHVTLSANTWHNVTYAYQGEGGSKVTYVDGRKVAEDQAEDTFGEYPPFAMTDYETGGYRVSVSSAYIESVYRPFSAFNDGGTDINNVWHSPPSYTGTSSEYVGDVRLAANVDPGHWIKLETPHKLQVSYVNLVARPHVAVLNDLEPQAPKDFQVCGSNDDVNWDVLASFTGEAPQDDGTSNYTVNAQRGYKYLALAVNKAVNSTSVTIANIKFYGHHENDLVRLPDPTNVLKYPHIAMTGPAQRGYVATASSNYSVSGNPGYFAFSELGVDNKWASENVQNYNGDSYLYSGSKNLGTNNGGSGTVDGEWLMIEMPHKLKLQSTRIISAGNEHEVPDKFIIYGSNDLTGAWSVVDNTYSSTAAAIPFGTTGKTWTVSTSTGSNYYKYFGIAVTHTTSSAWIASIHNWELYGTGVDSVPIQIGGGNIDQVGNFRVYDAYLDKDRVEEIWDAHKDYYGRAKSSMTLHKGRLGIGTDTPLRTLDIVGDVGITSNTSIFVGSNTVAEYTGPHSRLPKAVPLKKYPEIVFEEGKFDYNVSTNTYTQAGYTVTASSQYPTSGLDNYDPSAAFGPTPQKSSETGWHTLARYNNNGTYPRQDSVEETLGGYSGEWIKLESPNKFKLDNVQILPRKATNSNWYETYSPLQFRVLGSNDDTDWQELLHVTNAEVESPWTFSYKTFNVNATEYYKYYALSVYKINGASTYLFISDIKYNGYEEDPPAGDTSVDTTFTSIMNTPQTTGANVYVDGNLGETFTNRVTGPDATGPSATYDATGKYWELNGSLESNIAVEANTFLEGDAPHSVSVWFNSSNLEANVSNTCVFSVSDQEKLDSVNLDLQSNTWHNLTYAYQGEGGSRVTYLDGRKVAEDQAEDTFGDYPPFAMTGYSQGGYTVSASSELSGDYYAAWEAFNRVDTADESYISADGMYTGNGGLYNANGGTLKNLGTLTGGFSTTINGEYVIIEMPHKLKLSYVNVKERINQTTRAPGDGKIYGSNDGFNWIEVASFSGLTYTDTDNVFTAITANATTAYQKFALVVSKISGSMSYLAIGQLRFYGHRENDLVRLPDPTNVLKYPHIILYDNGSNVSEYAKRGYVVKASSHLAEYPPYHAFDGVYEWVVNQSAWISDGGYSSGVPTMTTTDPKCTTIDGVQTPGEWIELQTPHKIKVSYIKVTPQGENTSTLDRAPKAATLAGSIDGTTWETLLTWANVSDWAIESGTTGLTKTFSVTNNTNKSYNYFRLVSTETDGIDAYTSIQEFELYGTGVDSIPIQIGGGNIDKVANFRVYDKFVGEDQAFEIWDAQKDAFGRAKSSMTLHKGRLGIGTTEPEGRLAVADEPHGLEEFPPRAMQSSKVSINARTGYYDTHFEGHGTFTAYGSHEYVQPTDARVAWKAFSKQTGGNSTSFGYMNSGNHYTSGGTIYTGPESNGGKRGDFLGLKFPYKVKITHFFVMSFVTSTSSRGPKEGYLLGRINGGDWQQVHFFQNKIFKALEYTKFEFENDTFYDEYILVVTKTTGATVWNASELRYFGTREQGQSVLHDGQLTLTKSLTVPRIGPALDADDTPRRDRLVVEYNTSTNPTFEGAVRDTSGRGNDGVFYGGASYDATEKALKFDGTTSDQYVHTLKNGTSESGNIDYSVSLWFNPTTVNVARWRAIFSIGVLDRTQPTDNNGDEISLFVNTGTNALHLQNGGDTMNTGALNAGEWVHIVVTYDGTNRKIYLDGSLSISGGYTALNLPKEMLIRLAQSIPSGGVEQDEYMDCKISNFKTWFGAALTAEEVKTLYDMGRCDEGHHVVNFSKTRVGIGLGDGEVPRSTLDVRGTFQGNSSLNFYVLHGVHPNPIANQSVPFTEPRVLNGTSKIVSVSGVTHSSNDDVIPWDYHAESAAWEVQTYYDISAQDFVIFSQGTSTAGKRWSMYIVTT